MGQMVSDEVWQRLDPHAGGLPRRDIRRRSIAAALTAIVMIVGASAWWVGGITPRLVPGATSAYGADPGTIFYRISVRNDAYLPVTIVGAGRDGAGLELTSVDAAFPIALGRNEETEVTVRYQVTDCGAVTSDPWPVPVRVRRPWGTHTAYLALPTQDELHWRGGDLPPLPVRPGEVQWQRRQADLACALVRR